MSKKDNVNQSSLLKQKDMAPKPYNQTHAVSYLKFFVTVINHNHHKDVLSLLKKYEVGLNFITHGRGTATREIYDILGLSDVRKNIIFSVVKAERTDELKSELAKMFAKGKDAKGIAFAINISSVIGLSIYKYLSNTRTIGE